MVDLASLAKARNFISGLIFSVTKGIRFTMPFQYRKLLSDTSLMLFLDQRSVQIVSDLEDSLFGAELLSSKALD